MFTTFFRTVAVALFITANVLAAPNVKDVNNVADTATSTNDDHVPLRVDDDVPIQAYCLANNYKCYKYVYGSATDPRHYCYIQPNVQCKADSDCDATQSCVGAP